MNEQSPHTGLRRVLSGIQPTGNLHLGNYLGALKNFTALQTAGCEGFYCIVDLHAITMPQEPQKLAAQTRMVAAAMIACGLKPEISTLFVQSSVPAHTELAWILNCITRMGWLEKMTQFKDKSGTDSERASVGLFDYPVLQAADILLYKATHVPVGKDQKQHLELSRNIAARFNRQFDAPDFFPLPEPLIEGSGARVMSLRDGTQKMSKSDPAANARIDLTDDADAIARKIKKAKTDTLGALPQVPAGLNNRPEIANLIAIYAALTGTNSQAVLAEHGGRELGPFKAILAECAVAHMAPITADMRRLLADRTYIDTALIAGAEKANAAAEPVIRDVRDIVGFWNVSCKDDNQKS